MRFLVKTRAPLLILGDLIIFYGSLLLTLLIRYQELNPETLSLHLPPFTICAVAWIFVFFVGGLYEIKALRTNDHFYNRFFTLIGIAGIISIVLFYFVPLFGITPKRNLLIFVGLFTVLDYFWRIIFNGIVSISAPKTRVLLIGSNHSIEELAAHIKENPHFGYEISFWMHDGLQNKTAEDLKDLLAANRINLIVVPAHIKKDGRSAKIIYRNLPANVEVVDLANLYEIVFQKVSVAELEESWFLENLPARHRKEQPISRTLESVLALILFIIASPIFLLITLLVPLTSRGPAFYVQTRIGKNGTIFKLYKFRSMSNDKNKNPDADSSSPIWPSANDERITRLGKLLRPTHLDELPQLINIIRGDMSFIGPRPGRPELDKLLEDKIPYYSLRYLVRPGLSGWAQINYGYGASIEDEYQKLHYDLYYLKNRSFWLNSLIFLKTVKKVLD